MEIGFCYVNFVEAESLIKSQGAIKSSYLQADGAFTHRGFSLELADQSTSDSSAAVLTGGPRFCGVPQGSSTLAL